MDELFENLWPFGARDYINIGHKIIYTVAAYRMLKRMGWNYGLPVLRSVTLGLLYGSGRGPTIAPFATNQKLARKLKEDWHGGKPDPDDSAVVLMKLRQAEVEDAAPIVVELLGRGVAPASIWDGYRLLAADSLMRKPGILPVHPATAINAMHFAWRTTKRDATKRLLLLQGASWLALFRESFEKRLRMTFDKPGIEELKVADLAAKPDFAETVRRLTFMKGNETHVYKYAAAMLEESKLCHKVWAPRILAAGMRYLPTADQPDAGIYKRTRKSLKKLAGD